MLVKVTFHSVTVFAKLKAKPWGQKARQPVTGKSSFSPINVRRNDREKDIEKEDKTGIKPEYENQKLKQGRKDIVRRMARSC